MRREKSRLSFSLGDTIAWSTPWQPAGNKQYSIINFSHFVKSHIWELCIHETLYNNSYLFNWTSLFQVKGKPPFSLNDMSLEDHTCFVQPLCFCFVKMPQMVILRYIFCLGLFQSAVSPICPTLCDCYEVIMIFKKVHGVVF